MFRQFIEETKVVQKSNHRYRKGKGGTFGVSIVQQMLAVFDQVGIKRYQQPSMNSCEQ